MMERMLRTGEGNWKEGLERKRKRDSWGEGKRGRCDWFSFSLWCLRYLLNHSATLIQPIWLNCEQDKGRREEEIHAARDTEFQRKRMQKEQQIERKRNLQQRRMVSLAWVYQCGFDHPRSQVLMNAREWRRTAAMLEGERGKPKWKCAREHHVMTGFRATCLRLNAALDSSLHSWPVCSLDREAELKRQPVWTEGRARGESARGRGEFWHS